MSQPQYYALRVKGGSDFLTTIHGERFINVEWSPKQLQNVADANGLDVADLETVPVDLEPFARAALAIDAAEAMAGVGAAPDGVHFVDPDARSPVPDDGVTLECTCPLGAEDPACPEHQRLRRVDESQKP